MTFFVCWVKSGKIKLVEEDDIQKAHPEKGGLFYVKNT